MFDYRKKLGLIALVCSIAGLASCGGGSGTDNEKVSYPSCDDPLVVIKNEGGELVCGSAPPPFELPPCEIEGHIRNDNGVCVPPPPPPPPPVKMAGPGEVVIYVNVDLPQAEKLAAFSGYNLHLWEACGDGWANSTTDGDGNTWDIPTDWPNGPGITSKDNDPEVGHDPYYGAYFVLPIGSGPCGNYIIKTPGGTAQTNDLDIRMADTGSPYDRMAWVIINSLDMRASTVSATPKCLTAECTLIQPKLSIADTEAHFLDADTILWGREFESGRVELYRSANAGMSAEVEGGVENGILVGNLVGPRAMTDQEVALAPHLEDYFAYDIPTESEVDPAILAKQLIKEELLVVGRYDSPEDDVVVERGRGTRVQIPLALDYLYGAAANNAVLGVSYNGIVEVTASVWAPNAKNVELRVYNRDPNKPLKLVETLPMDFNGTTGVWSVTEDYSRLNNKYYRYRVETYNPYTGALQRLEVTDPYSVALATDSKMSMFVDLDSELTKPEGWDDLEDAHKIPVVDSPEEISIYEIHIRDFSILDESTLPLYRGKYKAFTDSDSAPVMHLKKLVDSGLTHVHFLPANDSSSVVEDYSKQINLESYVFELCNKYPSVFICPAEINEEVNPDKQDNSKKLKEVLAGYAVDSSNARRLIDTFDEIDGFNWGYDPYHFNAPEGSYAVQPEGFTRVKEMREMNMALHNMGLRVVMDVVYPHTVAAGSVAKTSVFDKIVPGYYYRGNEYTGTPEQGTGAGPDTATERMMMAKFVKDSLVHWSKNYKVDGFRFDQSGFMPKSVLVDSLAAVQEVDEDTYFYAEAWTPAGGTSDVRVGEDNRATQEALAGTGIGTFNDRIRNALQQMKLFNGTNSEQDRIRAGLAGNLKDFVLVPKSGFETTAESVGAYNVDPQEAINYVEKHDNETFWDWMHRPGALDEEVTIEDRVRIHSMTQSVVLLSQGVPFMHMGSDLLRSKSMSPNSYNAGDWFNKVDFTKQSNNWAVGLPPELRDGVTDEHVISVFNNVNTMPLQANLEKASNVFNDFLTIASTSPLFSLETADEVMDRVGFHDGGVAQINGLIVMSIDDGVGTEESPRVNLDPVFDAIVVVINGTANQQSKMVPTSTGFVLHDVQNAARPELADGAVDLIVQESEFTEGEDGGTFTVPAYTTAVFVKKQAVVGTEAENQGVGLSATATTDTLEPPVTDIPAPYGATDIYVRGGVSTAGWDATDVNKMNYDGSGIYSVILDVPAGTNAFKVAAADWATPNLGALATIVPGEEVTLAQGSNDNVNITIADAGLYRFELNALVSTTAPTLKVVDPDTFQGVPVFLRGTVSATGWGADSANQLVYEGDSIYALTLDITEGDYVFKVASDDWSTVNLGSATAVTLGDAITLTQGSGDNLPINIPADGTYRFEVNARNAEAVTVKVYVDDLFEGTPIYARGTVSSTGWGADSVNQLTYQGRGLYKLLLNITTGDYVFKIAEENWSNPNLGAPSATVGIPTTLVQGSNDNVAINIPSTGDYLFTLDTTKADAITITVDQE